MKKIVFLVLIVVLISGCTTNEPTGHVTKKSTVVMEDEKRMEVYFCPQDGCREKLAGLLKSAKQSIHCALFDLDLPEVKDALKRDDIDVKLVTDVDNEKSSAELKPVVNFGYQLTHNKFCVVDGKTFFTGSFNPTENCNFKNNNNMLIITSEHLAKNYEDEFDELYNEIFSGGSEVEYPIVYLKDTKVENYFCPDDSCSIHVIDALSNAKSEIYFMTFSFTDDGIGGKIVDLHNNGVKVKGVFENTQVSDYSEYNRFLENGMDVKKDNNKYNMHHKVFIIDNETVITGSYNPSSSGDEKNDENILIIHDKGIAKKFLDEFDKVWNYDGGLISQCIPAKDVVISEVYYDTTGKDSEEEYISIYNPTNRDVNLDYYFISRGDSNQRMSGIISSNGTKKFDPKFSLPNSGGYAVLSKGGYEVDYVEWESDWKLVAKKGEVLSRKSFGKVNCEEEWK
ncbi:MAG: hypothetical protein CO092_02150 [Candidatus Aenigmarchaeota archaeon CG_4_9_14_3_um_filter_37_18]|nr:MAG: hypothetical protein COZ04_03985 [Candidatus Aenigmarchaeota archaeon CG_4_10_14_3_um_filter_37_21]PJB75333.1 MAG: hypothetical protein CO092_02150 [Candidatus Aenigmarchaeota archaeon CG_4_9_14_3_um_filter_37_18]